jgi:hypothetical protein
MIEVELGSNSVIGWFKKMQDDLEEKLLNEVKNNPTNDRNLESVVDLCNQLYHATKQLEIIEEAIDAYKKTEE